MEPSLTFSTVAIISIPALWFVVFTWETLFIFQHSPPVIYYVGSTDQLCSQSIHIFCLTSDPFYSLNIKYCAYCCPYIVFPVSYGFVAVAEFMTAPPNGSSLESPPVYKVNGLKWKRTSYSQISCQHICSPSYGELSGNLVTDVWLYQILILIPVFRSQ
jgi:hypothetical protein